MTEVTDPGAGNLPGQLLFILLLATAFTLPVSIGLLTLYRRAVLRSMRTPADTRAPEHAPLEVSTPSNQPVQTAPDLPVLDRTSPITTESVAEALYSGLLRAPWRVAAVYAVAGCCYALVMAGAFLAPIGFVPFRFVLLFWVYAWPVVLTVNLVAASTWRARLATATVYFFILAVFAAIALTRSAPLKWYEIPVLWLITNLPATILLLSFLNRRVRAVGPLVLAFMTLALAGSQLALSIAGSDEGLLRSSVVVGRALGLNAYGVFIGLMVLGFAVFGLLGWLTLRWIRVRYEQKKISDQSITLDAIWLLFGIAQSILLISSGIVWLLSGLVAFMVYKLISWLGFLLLTRLATSPLPEEEGEEKSPKLLLLRVFSLGKRSERLFDALATHWRHLGPIQMIAGPDLATTTIEPHEFLDFLTGKLSRRFIDTPKTLELRLSEMDLEPDKDGRFRINDFFCHEDAWQMTLSRLVSTSDAVLMDLRSFSVHNRGVAYEIGELINVVPLERVTFVVDESTDEEFLYQSVQDSWEKMRPTSPNRSSTPGQLRLLRYEGSRGGELLQLLRVLSTAASSKPLTAAGS